jgi:hypothetical protein
MLVDWLLDALKIDNLFHLCGTATKCLHNKKHTTSTIYVAWEKPRTQELVFSGLEYASAPCVAFPLPFSYRPSQRCDIPLRCTSGDAWLVNILEFWLGSYSKFQFCCSPGDSRGVLAFTMGKIWSPESGHLFWVLLVCVYPEVKPVLGWYTIVSAAMVILLYFITVVVFVHVILVYLFSKLCYVILPCVCVLLPAST